ncbi:MAG: STAS domain-containing protein [Streptosporangiaceae bacterium]
MHKSVLVGRDAALSRLRGSRLGVPAACTACPAGLLGSRAGAAAGRWARVSSTRYFHTVINGVPVVTTPAEVDIATADQFRMVLLEAAARGGATVVVDMTGTRFCDTSGLHALVRAHKRAVAEGGGLRLVLPSGGAVPRIVTLIRLDLVLPCFSSLAQAVAPPAASRPGSARGAGGLAASPMTAPPGGGHVATAR